MQHNSLENPTSRAAAKMNELSSRGSKGDELSSRDSKADELSSHFSKADDLSRRAAAVIPNGMYGHQSVRGLPANFPQFYRRAQGCRLWAENGREMIDYLCGYGPNILGYNDASVERAVQEQRNTGLDTATGPSAKMVDLAEKLVSLTPGSSWCMLAKNGNDATTLALTVARAATGRKHVLVQPSGYHGAGPVWTGGRPGVLHTDNAYQIPYAYNDLESVRAAATEGEGSGDIAAIIVSAFDYRYSRDLQMPTRQFAVGVRELCDSLGALLVVDDVRAGFRISMSGSWHGMHEVKADLICYSKAISNGHALSALLGSARCRPSGAEKVFATGSFWFSAVAQAAACQTLEELEARDAIARMAKAGAKLKAGLARQAEEAGLVVKVTGPDTMPFVTFEGDVPMERPRAMAFCSECCRGGVLLHPHHNWFICLAHDDEVIDATLEVTKKAFGVVKNMKFS